MSDDVEQPTDKRPSRRVADLLLDQINRGVYPVGAALPTYRQLATDYGVAVNTAMAAVRLLRDEGFVSIRPNAAARVQDRAASLNTIAELHAVRGELAALHTEASRVVADLANLQDRVAKLTDHLTSDDDG